MALDRTDLRNLAELRVQDAKVLLDHGQYDGCYYLAGYAVECALKSVIAGRTRQHEFPDLNLARNIYTHNLEDFRGYSLKAEFEREFAKDPELDENWSVVESWSETSRYDAGRKKGEAETLYRAINDPLHGVLTCIKRYW